MEKVLQTIIKSWISGDEITKEFMNLLKDINNDYYMEFIKLVKRNTFDYYRSIEKIYIDRMLYMKMKRYHSILLELLDRCSPEGYYFGICNENLKSIYGPSYGFWKNETN